MQKPNHGSAAGNLYGCSRIIEEASAILIPGSYGFSVFRQAGAEGCRKRVLPLCSLAQMTNLCKRISLLTWLQLFLYTSLILGYDFVH